MRAGCPPNVRLAGSGRTAALVAALTLLGNVSAVRAQGSETLAAARGIVLRDGPATVTLKLAGGPLADHLAALAPNRRFHLVLKEARTAAPPSTLYRVYLGPWREASAPRDDPEGSLNFFNAEQNRPRVYSFDVTERVRTLQREGALTGSITVTIVPTAKPNAGSKPTIGEIALVAQ
jgi:hypothetical protein